MKLRRLRRADLPADAAALATFLIGKTLIRDLAGTRLAGRIVETEAYPPGDASGHAFVGPTRRNRSLFLNRGHAYVYFGYGLHYLLNVSAETAGTGAGVLLRAAEPVEGIETIEQNRGTARLTDLARGPARLAQAFAVDLSFDGIDLTTDRTLWVANEIRPAGEIGRSVRIGITKAVDRELRFFERGSPFVSGPKWLNA
ncbi:MAG TPA: DNA-3-methyladenine glycosylase [Xanthobacteraceae bacterium]|nr:DNA-3-methyladenine glycosylase [Xanthobacteraceae bacterium]